MVEAASVVLRICKQVATLGVVQGKERIGMFTDIPAHVTSSDPEIGSFAMDGTASTKQLEAITGSHTLGYVVIPIQDTSGFLFQNLLHNHITRP